MFNRALLLVNPHSRRGRTQLTEAVNQLKKRGLDLLQVMPQHPCELSDYIRQYQNQVDRVIIGGGDGTMNAAIAGLVDTQLPLGILPLGTANDLARTLRIPSDLATACQVLVEGRVHAIDVGQVNDHYFFNVASLGLSVQITEQLCRETKRRWGVLAYAISALQVFWKSHPFYAEIQAHGKSTQVKTVQIAIGNGRYYGGGMAIAHDATIDDQRLDLYSLELQHSWQILTLLPALWQGNLEKLPRVRTLEAQEIYITTRHPRAINTDGEITVQTPAHFRVLPRAVRVFTPS